MISWLIKKILKAHLEIRVRLVNNNGLSRNKIVTSVFWDDDIIHQYTHDL